MRSHPKSLSGTSTHLLIYIINDQGRKSSSLIAPSFHLFSILPGIMRLLNTTTLEFKSFFEDVPKYAILSHRWLSEEDGGETTYRQFGELRLRPEAQWPASLKKVKMFCDIAQKQGIMWGWSDTCCTYFPVYKCPSLTSCQVSRGEFKHSTLQDLNLANHVTDYH